MFANIQNYRDRIEAGREVEAKILNALRQKGFKIDDPTPSEDKYDKIDGWWVDKKGTKYPIQIKFRQSGDDIIFELIQNMTSGNEGRDLKSKAVIYLITNTHGITRMLLVRPIKKKAHEILDYVKRKLTMAPTETNFSGSGWEAKIQYDRAHGQKKLVAYLDPRLFDILATWNLNIH